MPALVANLYIPAATANYDDLPSILSRHFHEIGDRDAMISASKTRKELESRALWSRIGAVSREAYVEDLSDELEETSEQSDGDSSEGGSSEKRGKLATRNEKRI